MIEIGKIGRMIFLGVNPDVVRCLFCCYTALVSDRDGAAFDIPAIYDQFHRSLEGVLAEVACCDSSGFAGHQGQVVVLPQHRQNFFC